MNLEAWSTAASIGTFVVIGTTAVAALAQLRHLRSSNQIAILTEVYETLESDRFTAARRYILEEVPKLIEDPEVLAMLASPPPMPIAMAPIRLLANFFENLGAFVKHGIIDKDLACDLWGGVILSTWEQLETVVAIRRSRNPSLWENFEYAATLAKQYRETYPAGTFPDSMRRMEFSEAARDAAAAARRLTQKSL